MKVFWTGASGKVSRQALQFLLLSGKALGLELVLHSTRSNRIEGATGDIQSVLPLCEHTGQPLIRIARGDDDLNGAELVVFCAARWPAPEQQARFQRLDPSGRLVQSISNIDLVRDRCRAIGKHAPEATVLMVTNQSDVMAEVAREELDPNKVVGFGGLVDSARFRFSLCREWKAAGGIPKDASPNSAKGYIAGYHNEDMTYLAETVEITSRGPAARPPREVLDSALEAARSYGAEISRLQFDPDHPDINTGSSVLPGYGVYAFINAFFDLGDGPLVEPFNVRIGTGDAEQYGVEAGTSLSVPVVVQDRRITIREDIMVRHGERALLRLAQARFYEFFDRLHGDSPNKLTSLPA